MNKKTLFSIIILVVIVGLVYYFGFRGDNNLAQIFSGNKDQNSESGSAGEPLVGQSYEPPEVYKEPIIYTSLGQSYSYKNISFKYPEGFKIFQTPISSSQEVITVENEKATGFQIFIMSFNEPGPITPERIWQDEPGADVLEPKVADLDGVKALVFYGYNEDFGETFEVWAVYRGKLYQIAGPKTAENLIIDTLVTWNWQ